MPICSLSIQETWDEILDHLHDSPKDLKSSALVCHAFVSRTQMHLFRSMKVDCERSPPQWHRSHSHHQVMSAARLAQLLSHSPHLIGHIRELYIGQCNVHTLDAMAQIAWSRLHTIIFFGNENYHQTDVIALIGSLVSLPTVRKLSFHSMFWQSAHLHAVLGRCNSGVHSLIFERCYLPNTPYDIPPTTNPHRPIITSLVLFCVEGDFLNHSALPVDLSRLTHVTLHRNNIPELDTLLYTCRNTLQSLDFNGSERYVPSLDFGSFPALSCLRLGGVGKRLQQAIERSGTNTTIHTISYRLLWIGWEGNLRQLESIISAAKMPALRRVEIEIVASSRGQGPQTDGDWVRGVEETMPQLAERGILTIEVVADRE
ncbi:hypothetical protein B0H19DRAFT_92520 [Mycena capillaripes]|nr:hypothetical protein B0H19DRAFT_92520 [Mycena capillaripes]